MKKPHKHRKRRKPTDWNKWLAGHEAKPKRKPAPKAVAVHVVQLYGVMLGERCAAIFDTYTDATEYAIRMQANE